MPDATLSSVVLPEGLNAIPVAGESGIALVRMDQPLVEFAKQHAQDKVIGPHGKELVPGTSLDGLQLPNLKHYSALVQYNPFWIRPEVGFSASDLGRVSRQIMSLLWQSDLQQYHLLLPLIGSGFRAYLVGDEKQGLRLNLELDESPACGPLMVLVTGDDPHALFHDAVRVASQTLGTFRLREDKPVPSFVQMMGWCTWDAFYHDVNQDRLIDGLQTFADAGFKTPLVVLDDGWLTLDGDRRLAAYVADKQKFPDGLAALIKKIKADYGVKTFGVWHTLGGYWQGVSPDSELAKRYNIQKSADPLPRHDGDPLPHAYAVDSKDAARFYHDFYAFLRQQGVDMTKVDNQNAQAFFACDIKQRSAMVKAYQHAYQGAVWTHFVGKTIHCMCNRNDVAYNMSSTTVWRNSDDYFPNRDGSHQCHLVYNTMNNLWSSQFAVPDWDMFWSGAETGAFHAAARAISGSPVYVSDKPGEQNFDVLRKLCTMDGQALRCAQPALPAVDCLFVDYTTQQRLLKITNHNNKIGVLGLFHCLWAEEAIDRKAITDSYRASEVPGISSGDVAIYHHQSGKLQITDADATHEMTLDFRTFELLTISPIVDGVAMLGLLDKYNGSAAITSEVRHDAHRVTWELCEGGLIGIASQRPISQATVNGKSVAFTQVDGSELWQADVPAGGAVTLDVVFG
jgi:raffinose synthase